MWLVVGATPNGHLARTKVGLMHDDCGIEIMPVCFFQQHTIFPPSNLISVRCSCVERLHADPQKKHSVRRAWRV